MVDGGTVAVVEVFSGGPGVVWDVVSLREGKNGLPVE